jgi:hypothetical protein
MFRSSPPSYIVRPAIAQDKWHIQRLLGNFDGETPWRSPKLHYWVLGFLTALGINLSFLLGLSFLLEVKFLLGILRSALVKHWVQQTTKPLYLACFPDKIGFYTQLGFIQMRSSDLSPLLRHELGIFTRPDIVPLVLR